MEVQRQKMKKIRQKTTNILSKGRENPDIGPNRAIRSKISKFVIHRILKAKFADSSTSLYL